MICVSYSEKGIENKLEETPNPEHVGGLQPVIRSVSIGEASLVKDPHLQIGNQSISRSIVAS